MKNIVVGTDGSPSSMTAVRQAAEIATAMQATLHVAFAVRLASEVAAISIEAITIPAGLDDQAVSDAERMVAAAADQVRELAPTVQTHVVQGEPAHALIDLADKVSADLLVVGSRGMTGAARFLLGSVPNRCAHHAGCSVLIVRTD
jgi:nucleotide-binding universal stress UspA family protein